ncbi:MAG: tetratricopeptide repeat protein [Planctomycetaceae bacterium]|jgi:tetratricopeptide (TPR) repeat protein|nr:tetratricopeptide repeat protein [Planctomycetaceae bacterium]
MVKRILKVFKNKWVILGILSVFVIATRFTIMSCLFPKPPKSAVSHEDWDIFVKESYDLESGVYLSRAVAYEKTGKYKESLENYREYYELVPLVNGGADCARVHFFLGNKERAAKIYCRTLEVYESDAIQRFKSTTREHTLEKERGRSRQREYERVKYSILSNLNGLKQPFTTIDELINFPEKTEKRIPSEYGYRNMFSNTIDYLRKLQPYEKANSDNVRADQ